MKGRKMDFKDFEKEMSVMQAEAKKKLGWCWKVLCRLGIHSKTVYWKHVRDGEGTLTVMVYCHRCMKYELVKT